MDLREWPLASRWDGRVECAASQLSIFFMTRETTDKVTPKNERCQNRYTPTRCRGDLMPQFYVKDFTLKTFYHHKRSHISVDLSSSSLFSYPPTHNFKSYFAINSLLLGEWEAEPARVVTSCFFFFMTLTSTTWWGAGSVAPLKVKVVPLQVGRGAGPQGWEGRSLICQDLRNNQVPHRKLEISLPLIQENMPN